MSRVDDFLVGKKDPHDVFCGIQVRFKQEEMQRLDALLGPGMSRAGFARAAILDAIERVEMERSK